jgi:hypothetical protein
MLLLKNPKPYQRWIAYGLAFVAFLFIGLMIVAQFLIVPILKNRLQTLIVQGSDSLYTYTLGNLDASIFGGNVELENLQVSLNNARYQQLKENNELPPFTIQLNMIKGEIKGVAIFSLLFEKKILIDKIITTDANLRLLRHLNKGKSEARKNVPLWKSIQPAIKSIAIENINLDGVKLLYRNADTSASLKLQFDTCHAVFNNFLIDSSSSVDTSRIGFSKSMSLRFSDLKFRTADSMSKMKAEIITYSSESRLLEIANFKFQPTREEKKDFYAFVNGQEEMNVIEFEKATLSNFQIAQFVSNNAIAADSLIVQKPTIDIYLDKTLPILFKNKIGNYPHQKLLSADLKIIVKGVAISQASIRYTEKATKSKEEGSVTLSDINITANNVTNDSIAIISNNICKVTANGFILDKSPVTVDFIFYLDSSNGRFDAKGTINNVNAAQLNEVAVPFANVELQSFNLHQLSFAISGEDLKAKGNVGMRYDGLFLTIRKTNTETGVATTNNFLTKIVNKYTLHSSNPAAGQAERNANVVWLRISSKGFFGTIWKTIFSGMQNIMVRQGQYE